MKQYMYMIKGRKHKSLIHMLKDLDISLFYTNIVCKNKDLSYHFLFCNC